MSRSSTSSSERGPRARDLVVVPEDVTTPAARARALGIVGFFLVVIVGTAAVDTLRPAPVPRPIGIEKANDERRRANARWLDGSAESLFEDDLELRSRVRASVRPKYARLLFQALREVEGDQIAGRDGWLFLRSRTRSPTGEKPRAMAQRSAAQLAALDRWLALAGIEFTVVPIPRKELIYAYALPRGIDPQPELDGLIVDELRLRGVDTIDLQPAFHARASELVYYRYGTHWSPLGQWIAAEEIARALGWWLPEDARGSRVRALTYGGDTDLLEGLGLAVEDARALADEVSYPNFVLVNRRGRLIDPSQANRPGRHAITGTSFTGDEGLPYFLWHFSNKSVWNIAVPGSDGISPLAQFLAANPHRTRPETILAELPVHICLSAQPFQELGRIFAENPPPGACERIEGIELRSNDAFARGAVELDERGANVVVLEAGRVAHSGEGVIAVRLRGSAATPLEVLVACGNASYRAPWEPGREELILPVITHAPGAPAITISAHASGSAPARVEVRAADLVATVRTSHGVELAPQSPRIVGGLWRQDLDVPNELEVASHAMLVLEVDSQASTTPEVTVRVRNLGQGPAQIEWQIPPLAGEARVVLSLAAFERRELEAIEIVGAGDPPATYVTRARLCPLP